MRRRAHPFLLPEFNNRAITWLLRDYNRIYDDPDMSLDLYTRQCSVGITAQQLSVCAATIANKGLNPVTQKQVFGESLAHKITTLISSVGFYQHTGDWLYTSPESADYPLRAFVW